MPVGIQVLSPTGVVLFDGANRYPRILEHIPISGGVGGSRTFPSNIMAVPIMNSNEFYVVYPDIRVSGRTVTWSWGPLKPRWTYAQNTRILVLGID